MEIKKIKLSTEGDCADSSFCYPVEGKLERKKEWITSNDLFLNKDGRVFALVNTYERVFFMDAITGSLYDFGKCVTSSTLTVNNLVRNKEKANELLLRYVAPTQISE